MKFGVFGLGHLGATTAACLVKMGHTVTGFDTDLAKVATVNAGRSPIREPGVEALIARAVAAGSLAAFGDNVVERAAELDATMICVGSPSDADGNLRLDEIVHVTRQLGAAAARRAKALAPLLCIFRTTMAPGTMDDVVVPAFVDASGERPGACYEPVFHPEFLRELSAVADFFAPPKIVIGERRRGITRHLLGLYDGIKGPVFELSFKAAEMLKLVDNGFHGLKTAFANEIGQLCLDLDIVPSDVMEPFLGDIKLNLSASYLRPGGAFGGPCLRKDLRALTACARRSSDGLPVMQAALSSNETHKAFLLDRVLRAAPTGTHMLLLGLSFKNDTDDVRDSPLVELADALLARGCRLSICDPDLSHSTGSNGMAYLARHFPHLLRLLVDDVAAAGPLGIVVEGKGMPSVRARIPLDVPIVSVCDL